MVQITSPPDGENKAAGPDALLTLIGEMADEMHPGQGLGETVGIDKSLDGQLGFDSLSRVELIHRIESRFAVALPESAFERTETPRDLWREISAAGHGPAASASLFAALEPASSEPTPDDAETLNDVLAWHARQNTDNTHVRILAPDGDDQTVTFGELYRDAERLAAALLGRDLQPGESVLLMLPTGREYFVSFFGVLLAGGVPVPVYPPGRPQQLEEHLRRHGKIADLARAGIMITVAEAVPFSRLMAAQAESLRAVVTCPELLESSLTSPLPRRAPGDTAFLQFTSGSTGDPKGVILSHANLLANIRAMGRHLKAGPPDVFISWLPLYHDMGLIGAWLGSLVYGMPLVIMSPLNFLARPQRWLQAIDNYRGTISGGPNFAYEICATRIRDEDIEGLDLSSWRVAFNGAEAVSPVTMDKFCARFKDYGFRREAMTPVYGLAENSVGLAFPPLDRGPKIDIVERQSLALHGRAVEADPADGDTANIPACGHPLPGHEIRIVDDTGHELPDRRQGHIQFRGPSGTSGYLRNEQATADLFDGEWRNSGDLGYLALGDIHITGRQKDLIIRAGRNIYPAELEEAVGGIDGIQSGNVAVFGSPEPETGAERLIIMAECRRRDEQAQAKLKQKITGMATDLVGAAPDDIVLVAPRSVPKTSSGKIRRQSAKTLYETGQAGSGTAAIKWQLLRMALSGIGPTLRKYGRALGARSYAIYGLLVLAVLAPAAWLLVALIPHGKSRWAVLRLGLRLLMGLTGIRLTVEGLENLPRNTPLIIAANHASYIDGAMLISALPGEFSFVAKAELKSNFVSRIFLSRLGTLFVERFDTGKSLADAEGIAGALKRDRPLIYFPEGTFTRMPGLLPFHMGAFSAAAAGVPILPIALRGTRAVLRDDSGFLRPGHVRVKILEPVTTDGEEPSDDRGRALKLRDTVRAAILAHNGEPDLAHERVLPALAEKNRDD